MIRVGVAGYGYWGPNLVTATSSPSRPFEVVAVADPSAEAARRRRQQSWRSCRRRCAEMMDAARYDAVAIATPVATHYDLAANALRKGKHVLVEKPLCACAEEAADLIALAERQECVLLVDHVFVFHNAVRKLKRLMSDSLGTVSYYDLLRVNLGAIPARHERVVGSCAARFLDHELSVRRAAGARRGDRLLPRQSQLARYRLRHRALRLAHDRASQL